MSQVAAFRQNDWIVVEQFDVGTRGELPEDGSRHYGST